MSQTPEPADGGFFWEESALDASQVAVIAGERHCETDFWAGRPWFKCDRLVDGAVRADYSKAMYLCYRAGYTRIECDESVRAGEF